MTTKLTMEELRKRAAQETEQGQAELLTKLRRMSPSELTKVDPKIISRLTQDQRISLFCASGIDHIRKQPNHELKRQTSSRLRGRPLWRFVPPILRGPLLGITVGVAAAMLGIFHETIIFKTEQVLPQQQPLSSHARSWPTCTRLSRQTDNCLYRIQRGMPWSDASAYLGMDMSDLKHVNPHLSPRHSQLAQGDLLIVWRGITPIQENSHVQ